MTTDVLRRAVRRNGGRLTAGTVLICLHQLCEAAVPILIGVIVDRAITPGDGGALAAWIAALAGLFTALTLVYRYGARTLMRAIAQEAHLLRVEVAGRMLGPRGVRTDLRTGDVLTISGTDADMTAEVLDYIPRTVAAVVVSVACAVTLLVIDVPLGLAVLVAVPLVVAGLHFAAPVITRRVAERQEAAGRAASLATDLVTGVRPLRGLGAEDTAARRYERVSGESLAATLRAARTQALYTAVSTACGALPACGVALFAGWFALRGDISAGELLTVIGLAQFLMEPVELLALVPGWVASARASGGRVALVVNAPALFPAGEPAPPPDARGDATPQDRTPPPKTCGAGQPPLEARGTGTPHLNARGGGTPQDGTPPPEARGAGTPHLNAPGDGGPQEARGAGTPHLNARGRETPRPGVPVLEVRGLRYGGLVGLDLSAAPGEFVGVVAHRSADGDALVQVLSGQVPPGGYEGAVRLGGGELADLDPAAARRTLLVEPHRTDLFEGTLGDNLTAAAADPADLPLALVAAAAADVIATQPGGLDQPLTERGSSLSGGQRQRVALARALLARPPILVLHDPTTAVDAVTEHAIAQGIRDLRTGHTTVVVTSSPALLAAADRVVVIDDGRTVAEGPHTHLSATDPAYRKAVLR